MGTPGLVSRCQPVAGQPIRNMWVFGDYLWPVCGNRVYRVDTSWSATICVGALDTSSGYAWMADNGPANGNQLMIVDGTSGYIITGSTPTVVKIADTDFITPSSLTFQDGYFIVT